MNFFTWFASLFGYVPPESTAKILKRIERKIVRWSKENCKAKLDYITYGEAERPLFVVMFIYKTEKELKENRAGGFHPLMKQKMGCQRI